jgi:hypothetical protein
LFELDNYGPDLRVDSSATFFRPLDWTYEPPAGEAVSSSGADVSFRKRHDCSAWLSVNKRSIVLPGKRESIVPVKVAVPKTAHGLYWCTMTFRAPLRVPGSIQLDYLIPVILSVGPEEGAKIKAYAPKFSLQGSSASITVPLENLGPGYEVVGAKLTVLDADTGKSIWSDTEADRNLFPETRRALEFTKDGLSDGNFVLVSTPLVGGKELPPMETKVRIQSGVATVVATDPAETVDAAPVVFDAK